MPEFMEILAQEKQVAADELNCCGGYSSLQYCMFILHSRVFFVVVGLNHFTVSFIAAHLKGGYFRDPRLPVFATCSDHKF